MRIDNSTHHNNSNTFQKKKKSKKHIKEQDVLNQDSDQVDLSSEVILLSHLLNAPEHQYTPLPFYFPDTALRNTQRASSIAKSIQQKAMYQGANLNYDMILDLVLSHSNEIAKKSQQPNNMNTMQDYQHIPLRSEESQFFENLHHQSVEQQLAPELIYILVMEYAEHMQARNKQFENTAKQAQQLRWIVNNSTNLSISEKKQSLISIIEMLVKT